MRDPDHDASPDAEVDPKDSDRNARASDAKGDARGSDQPDSGVDSNTVGVSNTSEVGHDGLEIHRESDRQDQSVNAADDGDGEENRTRILDPATQHLHKRSKAKDSPTDLIKFGEELAELEVVDAETLESLRTTIGPDGDKRSMIDQLERSGKLSPYQSRKLKTGSIADIRLDDYLLVDKIGEGGMGEVYKAQNIVLGRIEAIKTVVHPGETSNMLIKRFKQEARVLARLEHPAIVPIYKVGRHENTDFIAMKFVEGEDLASKVHDSIGAGEWIAVGTACWWIAVVANALHHAHQHNIVHRDIKPGNIMLTKTGDIIVLDMGIARLTDSGGQQGGLTTKNRGLGTPEYMPPEQWADATAVTAASDIYSLGATLVYVLTGRPPYQHDNAVKLMKAHTNEPIPSVRSIRGDVPAGLDEIIQRALAKKPSDRFDSARTFEEALAPYVELPPPTHNVSKSGYAATVSAGSALSASSGWRPYVPLFLTILLAAFITVALFGPNSPWGTSRQTGAPAPPPSDGTGVPRVSSKAETTTPANAPKTRVEKSTRLSNPPIVEPDPNKAKTPKTAKEEQPATTPSQAAKAASKTQPAPANALLEQWNAFLQRHARENPLTWKSLRELQEAVREFGDTSSIASESEFTSLKTKVESLTKRRSLRRAADEWMKTHIAVNQDLWKGNELQEFVRQRLDLDQIDSRQAFQDTIREVEQETGARAALLALRSVLSLHASHTDLRWELRAGFIMRPQDNEEIVTSAKVDEPVYPAFQTNRTGYLTVVRLNLKENAVFLISYKVAHVGDVYDVEKLGHGYRFTESQKETLFVYGTDQPVITEPRSATIPGPDTWRWAFPNVVSADAVQDALEEGHSLSGLGPHERVRSWNRTSSEITIEPK